MKLGYSKLAMEEVSVPTAIRHIADIGYDGIELDVDSCVETGWIAGLLKNYNLRLASIGVYTEVGDDAYSRNICQLKKGIDFAAELAQDDGPPPVNVGLTGIFGIEINIKAQMEPDLWKSKKHFFAERIGELVDYAKKSGVIVAIEPGTLIMNTPDKILELLKLVGSSHLKVNFHINESDKKTVSELIPVSVHAHVYDVSCLSEPSAPTDSRHIAESADFLKTMQAQGYDGFITATVSSLVCCRQGYDPLDAAKFAYEHMSLAFKESGVALRP
ncbi:MAG: sugar phosphate isomerase/epimerase [Candidatus Poribacteria bacterium]|nr:sugar phosphate isomerase/epimerase [Candidatus Poribacteria bacterium]